MNRAGTTQPEGGVQQFAAVRSAAGLAQQPRFELGAIPARQARRNSAGAYGGGLQPQTVGTRAIQPTAGAGEGKGKSEKPNGKS